MNISSISKLLSKLNIARQCHFISLKISLNNINLRLLEKFYELGVIRGYNVRVNENCIKVFFKYTIGGKGFVIKFSQVSTNGKRVYVDLIGLLKLKELSSNTIYLLSTDVGFLFDYECIMQKKGGEVIIKIVM